MYELSRSVEGCRRIRVLRILHSPTKVSVTAAHACHRSVLCYGSARLSPQRTVLRHRTLRFNRQIRRSYKLLDKSNYIILFVIKFPIEWRMNYRDRLKGVDGSALLNVLHPPTAAHASKEPADPSFL